VADDAERLPTDESIDPPTKKHTNAQNGPARAHCPREATPNACGGGSSDGAAAETVAPTCIGVPEDRAR
jgi:hypothetical protein